MTTFLVIVLVLFAVVPGAAVVLAGVLAMFLAPSDYDMRRKRLAEGLCVYCGYDLRGTAGAAGVSGNCPECGKPPFEPPGAGTPGARERRRRDAW